MMPLTSQEYAARAGSCCPYCESGDIIGSGADFDSNVAWMNVRCEDCGKEWRDEFMLVGYSEY